MSDNPPSTPDEDAPLEAWRQGDFALDVGGFLFATPPAGDYPFDAKELTEGIVGLVAGSAPAKITIRNKMPRSGLKNLRGSGSCGRLPWERRPAAIQSQSRQDGAPTVVASKLTRFLRPE